MAEATLNEGTISLDAAGWSDATGFADDAELAIIDSYQTHTNLDRTANTTTGINYLHIRGGSPKFGPANGNLKVEFKAAYSTRPQFVCDGGEGTIVYLECNTTAANKIELVGEGEIRLFGAASGTAATIVVGGNVRCYIDSTLDVVTKVTVTDNGYCEIEDKSADNVPTVEVSGNGRVVSERRIVTCNISDNGRVWETNTSGSSMTTLTITGGEYWAIGGDVATINYRGGRIREEAAKYSLTLGSTAFNVLSNRVRVPVSTDLVTVSNVSRDLESGGPGGGV